MVDKQAPADLIDTLVGIEPGQPLYDTRHARQKVVDATQASHELFFGDKVGGLPLDARLLVALHASLLSRSPALAAHYRDALQASGADAAAVTAVEAGDIDGLPASTLKAMLEFAGILITRPLDGDRAALARLQAAGLGTPDIVTLAQLVAYLSYQIRMVAGLAAMKALEQA